MKLFKYAALALCLLAPLSQASMRIAVVDSDMALAQSEAGKRYLKEAEATFAPRAKSLNALEAEIRDMEEKLKKDGLTLSQTQLESRKLDIRRKIEDFRLQEQQYRQDRQASNQAEMGKIVPKLKAAIEQVSKEEALDAVLPRQAVIYFKPELDATRKVIDSMNKMK